MATPVLRARAAITAALIGDAAALGTHWIYGQGNVGARLGTHVSPAFAAVDEAHFTPPAYFAHGGKAPGDLTHLGEATRTALRAMAAAGQPWPGVGAWRKAFVAAFGPGGSWVGYSDTATRHALANFDAAVARAAEAAAAPDVLVDAAAKLGGAAGDAVGSDACAEALLAAVGDDARDAVGADVAAAFAAALAAPIGSDSNSHTNALMRVLPVAAAAAALGVDDAAWRATVETAIRDVQNNDESVVATTALLSILRAVIAGDTIADALTAAAGMLDGESAAAVERARSLGDVDAVAVAHEHFGSACPLAYTVPCLFHLLDTTTSLAGAVDAALFVGGDNAPRAAFVAAVHAAAAGSLDVVPHAWRSLTADVVADATALLDAVLPLE